MILALTVALLLSMDNPADLRPRLRPLPPPPPRAERPLKVRPDPSVFLPPGKAPGPKQGHAPRETARAIEAALEHDPALVQQHRGYLRYLEAHPPMAKAEETWWEITGLRDFGAAVEALDEVLLGDLQAQTLLDQFYDEMARDETLRTAVEALFRAEFVRSPRGRRFSAAYDFLRAHPDVAGELLNNPHREALLPEKIRGLADYLSKHPTLVEGLREAFDVLMSTPNAHTRAFPWWEAVAALDQGGSAFTAMSTQFHDHPHRFWLWHARNLRMAEDVQARAWIRYWHRKVRRTPTLAESYADYLAALRKEPVMGKAAELRWKATFGEAPAWPPKAAPPRLTARPAAAQTNEFKTPEKPIIHRPRRPSRLRPALPSMPTMPRRPAHPARPQRPETPAPSTTTGARE